MERFLRWTLRIAGVVPSLVALAAVGLYFRGGSRMARTHDPPPSIDASTLTTGRGA